jgi:hypothetical protein
MRARIYTLTSGRGHCHVCSQILLTLNLGSRQSVKTLFIAGWSSKAGDRPTCASATASKCEKTLNAGRISSSSFQRS